MTESLFDGCYVLAPAGYIPTGSYRGLQFPIRKGDLPKPWVIIDECSNDAVCYIKTHLDADIPENMLLPEKWKLWPNAKRLSDWHNEPFRRKTRMAMARMTTFGESALAVIENHYLALGALALQGQIIAAPDECHAVARLDWSPSGQVWKDGRRWVEIKP